VDTLCLALAMGCTEPLPSVAAAVAVKGLRGFEPGEMKQFGKPGRLAAAKSPPPGFRARPPGADDDSYTIFRVAGSRDWPKFHLFKAHATEGSYALRYEVGAWHERYSRAPAITGHPPIGGYHNVHDWLYQRHCLIWAEGSPTQPLDWSAYQRLRFDVYSADAPAVLGVRARDATATEGRPRRHPHGLRTALGVFRVPQGKQVTCELPLADMARAGELDLSKVHWMHIRLNGFEGKTAIFIDNLRLLAEGGKEETKLPLLRMEGKPRPFARRVWDKNPPSRARRAFHRELGPVEKLGPVTVVEAGGQYACGYGHFGGHGGTYFQSARRGVVAYDNRRLLVVVGARAGRARPFTWGGVAESGGVLALASFDGGRTWGGLTPGEAEPALIQDWYWRATLAADACGDLYSVGTQNCDSYVEGYDVFFRRLAFNGTGWAYDRFSIVDQNGYKCPGPARALRLASGRIWAAWTDGFGGIYAKCSDDDGLTWKPCKDASIETLPRPFYEPKLEDLGKPEAPKPPKEVLLWPAEPVVGPLLVPYKGQVAAIAYDGSRWAAHDGTSWGPTQRVPWRSKRGGQASEAVPGDARIFLARAEGKGDHMQLVALRLENGKWTGPETLATGELGSSIVTASGDAVFCFYVLVKGAAGDPAYSIYCRRWKNGAWGPAVNVATEKERINELAAPAASPPTYAAIFWDQYTRNPRKPTWVRFARIPNR